MKAVAPSPVAVEVGNWLRLMALTACLFHSSIVPKTILNLSISACRGERWRGA
jgi:hypothetical protein